ncbi:MAG: rhomboid family intramembrane serine protease [Planctomycetes bacterium]|nr:rhomboid family intramembrane serine protease [Planctomycetota bacterium]
MRCIGHLDSQSQAEQLGRYLFGQDIENQVEANSQGAWEIWVMDEDQIEQAKSLLQTFSDNPTDPSVAQGIKTGLNKQAQLKQEQTTNRARIVDARAMLQRPQVTMGWVTISLIVISVGVALLTRVGKNEAFVLPFQITEHVVNGNYIKYSPSFPEIRGGQVWRLFTPMFLHFGILHLVFNMLWMKDLGSAIESVKGPWTLLGLAFTISILSNVAQFYVSGPRFGGMSGVVFGLLGYMWMQGKFNPGGTLRLNPKTVQFMMIWFVICLTGMVGPVANTVHGVGAFVGVAWGYLSAKREAGS